MEPMICVAILAKQKAHLLPAWLEHLEQWDYPKSRIKLYIRSNNNTDETKNILLDWARRNDSKYFDIIEDYSDVDTPVQQYGVHEWNAERFKVLGKIREQSVRYAYDTGCDYYFVCDVDNFLLKDTLSRLVSYNLPVVSPLLYDAGHTAYSNFVIS